ncbi:porin family protein [Xenorhabdus littoralis]|uniref:porin family protein n=1 Tax=Xenorhabdus littoralis TaxID=2582835 RepID=UPI0029E7F457|nr:porin family protein [Xenorhabdus sp. psl]
MTGKRRTSISILLTTLLMPLLMAPLILFYSAAVYADAHEESGHRIWQETQYNQQENQQKNEASLIIPDAIPTKEGTSAATGHGQQLKIENNLKDTTKALYFAINDQQWSNVKHLLVAYQKMPEYDPLLVDFAKGGLARIEGNLALSASHYQKILSQKPNFTRIKLELARVYFEDHKNREAEQLFNGLREQHQLPEIVLQNIDRYLQALPLRNSWHSSFSFGYAYDDNINMSPNQKAICLLTKEGKCIIERNAPKPIKESGSTYNATLSRRYSLIGHHGIFGRGLIYGKNYPHYHDGNENTFLLVSGYSYKSRDHNLSVGPLFEYKQRAGKAEYHAIGAKIEGQWAMTAQTFLNVELTNKRLSYPQSYSFKDGELYSSYFSLSHIISNNIVLFGGGNWVYRDNQQPADRYQQWGVSAGIAGQFYPGIKGSLIATLRQQHFEAYSALLGAKRQDNEQIYTASIKFPNAKILGMTPSLTFQHRHNRSNVGWLYSYDKNEIQIQLEKYF